MEKKIFLSNNFDICNEEKIKPKGKNRYMTIHQTGFETIFVKINKLKSGTSA